MIKLSAFADESANSLEGQISALQRNGIAYLEIRNVNGKNVGDLTDEEAKSIEKKLRENGIQVWSIGSAVGKTNIHCDFEKYKLYVRRVCEIAKLLNCKRVRMFSFFNAYEESEKVHCYLEEMLKIAKEENIELCHENEKDIYGDKLCRVEEILNAHPDLKSVYDPANFLQVGEKAEDTQSALISRTEYFHIKDVISATGELVPAGYGDGKIKELVEKIATRDIVLSVEPHLAVFKGYSDIDGTEMKNKFHFSSNEEAFDAAVNGIKSILKSAGYQETASGFVKE